MVLYDQYNNDANNGIVSTNRSDSPSFTSQAADDFVVPTGPSWSITQVDFRGFPERPCSGTVNVFFYLNASALPGSQVAAQLNSTLGGTEPDLSVTLSPAVVLSPGTYWVSVQCNMTGDNWYWGMRTVQSNSPAAWKEAGGYGTGCTAWANRGTCTGTSSLPDQMFRLSGTVATGGTLYDQYDNLFNNAIVSTNRSDSPSFTSQAADDFVVPTGPSWSITQVDFRGYPGLPCSSGTVNVFFYLNASALPGSQVAAQLNSTLGGTEPDLSVTLSPAVVLSPGTYWVSVQCNMTGDNWYWGMRTVQSNSPAAWKEAGGYGTGCTFWGNRGICTGTTSSPDHVFRLIGTSSTPTAVTLASFAARAGSSGVTVSWRTAAEVQTLGFNVWRSTASARRWVKLNASLIRAKGAGSSYRYLDRSARPGARYLYRLETMKLDGSVSRTAPLSVSVRAT